MLVLKPTKIEHPAHFTAFSEQFRQLPLGVGKLPLGVRKFPLGVRELPE